MSAGMMARVRGIRIRMVVPTPRWVETSTVPPILSMLVLTTSIPTPRPDTMVIEGAVEIPGTKMSDAVS